jgi:hypothetical protein
MPFPVTEHGTVFEVCILGVALSSMAPKTSLATPFVGTVVTLSWVSQCQRKDTFNADVATLLTRLCLRRGSLSVGPRNIALCSLFTEVVGQKTKVISPTSCAARLSHCWIPRHQAQIKLVHLSFLLLENFALTPSRSSAPHTCIHTSPIT